MANNDLNDIFIPKGGMFNIFKNKTYRDLLDYAAKLRDYYIPYSEKYLLESIENGGGIISGEDLKITLVNDSGGKIKLSPNQARYFINKSIDIRKA